MLDVFLTIDSELSPDNLRRGVAVRDEMDVSFYGHTTRGDFGVPFQMDLLDAHGHKGEYITDSLLASCTGHQPLREMVGVIRDRGHDVQLHIHTEWLPATVPPVLAGRSGLNMHCFSEDEQAILIDRGRDNLLRAGASQISAFRAGNMGADRATLRALARNGIKCDSSYFAPYLQSHCKLGSLGDICQPLEVDGVVELPISSFQDFPGHSRPMQLCASSSSELQHGLLQAWERGWQSVVLLWHSFELINRPAGNRSAPAPANLIISRFKQLCRFLAGHPDKFRTATFASPLPRPGPATKVFTPLKSSVWRTAWRLAEQAAGAALLAITKSPMPTSTDRKLTRFSVHLPSGLCCADCRPGANLGTTSRIVARMAPWAVLLWFVFGQSGAGAEGAGAQAPSAQGASNNHKFVAENGSDAAPGTAVAPWRTLQHAADHVVAGDYVRVRLGHYAGFQLTRSGTAEKPITCPGETGAVIDSPHPGEDGINLEGASYIVIDGFEVTGAGRAGIRSVINYHVTIRNNRSDRNGMWGIFVANSDFIVIEAQ